MIISVNSDPNRSEFDTLLGSTIDELNIHAQKSTKKVATLLGRNIEPIQNEVDPPHFVWPYFCLRAGFSTQ